ncbi:response regulator [Microbacterium sp. GCS4]|uniref:response regulator n=1 Tax=Microbacterium sp. GCS4 TaxID=1692239 RepID=UPI000682A0F4|nr:response regulator transcription factor [Microbacterium sp. GCS4]KNY04843.1 LuxR family transcriptional regulator [Microbacterium sp. GCS4]
METVRVLIADDETLVRRALSVFIEGEAGMTVVAVAADGAEAVAMAAEIHPDVVLMDLQMPRMGGIEAIRRITADLPGARVIALTTFGTMEPVLAALNAGASGYLLKDTDPEDIISAIREIHAGGGVLSPRVTERLLSSIREGVGAGAAAITLPELSDRESEVLTELAHGRSNIEIAAALHLSPGTIKGYLSSIMAKWDARDRVQVLVLAARAGLISFAL